MQDKFRAVARRCYQDMGIPRVGREVVGLYPTRKEAEDACTQSSSPRATVLEQRTMTVSLKWFRKRRWASSKVTP
jgi:hypothetical protein